MTTSELATQLVEFLRRGDFELAQRNFLAENAVSIEPNDSLFPERTIGLDKILAKGAAFRAGIQSVNSLKVSDALVAGNTLAVSFILDAVFKGSGQVVFSEICVFSVANGKIVQESFFY